MWLRRVALVSVAVGLFVFMTFFSKPKYYLSVCAIFRNEARFLPEWIEYHRLRGVQHFYLVNNLSEDGYKEALQPYVDEGVVELYEWPYASTNQKEWNKIQCSAYAKILRDKKRETRWMAIIDTDEFLDARKTRDLKVFLKPYEPYGGIGVNWQLFGTSGVEAVPEGKALIGMLTHRAPQECFNNRFLKSIVQPKRVKKISEPHYCRFKKPFFHVNEKFERLPSSSLSLAVSVDTICVHHYTHRDEHFFKSEKQKRLFAWYPDFNLDTYPRYNDIEDLSLRSYALEVEEKLQK